MVNRDTFNFNITASNAQAKDSLDELKKRADDLEKAMSNIGSGGKMTLNQEFSDLVQSLVEANKQYAQLKQNMQDQVDVRMSSVGPNGMNPNTRNQVNQMRQEQKKVEQEMGRLRNLAQSRGFERYEQQTESRARFSTSPGMYTQEQSPAQERLQFHRQRRKELENQSREAMRLSTQAMKTNYINHGDASRLRSLNDTLLSPTLTQGVEAGNVLRQNFQGMNQGSYRAQTIRDLSDSRVRISEIQGQMSALNDDRDNMSEQQFSQTMNELKEELKTTEEVVKSTKDSLASLDEVAAQLTKRGDELSQQQIREKAPRDSWSGRLSERSFSIGLAMTAAASYAVGSAFSSGNQTLTGMREDSLNVGYRTGNYDFRGIRSDYMDMGADQGWRGSDMLNFSDTILNSLGFRGEDNLLGNMESLMDFSKFSGAGTEGSSAYMESMYRSGAVTTADQARAVQDGFIGAIKASGMEGREREQIEALTAINENVTRGREMTQEEMRSREVMTSVLSGTGNRALQGDNLANFMLTADEAVRGADPFGSIGMLMGVGSDERYSGSEWLYNWLEDTQGGLTPDVFNTIMGNLNSVQGENPDQLAAELVSQFGLDTDVRAMRDFIAANPNGIPTGADGESYLRELQNSGSAELDSREDAYMDSDDQSAQSAAALKDQMQLALNDNKMVGLLDDIKSGIYGLGASSPGAALGVTAGGGLLTGLMTGVGSIISSMVGTTLAQAIGGKFSMAGAASGGFGGGLAGLGGLSGILGSAQGLAGSVLPFAAKAAPALAIGAGVYNIATAEDKAGETINQVGSVGGGLGGMKLGALAGSALGPLGTLLGGGVGYLAGSFLGGKGGEWVNNTFRGSNDPEVQVKSHYAEATTSSYEEQASNNAKLTAEQLRSDNISREIEVLDKFETLIASFRSVLQLAGGIGGPLDAVGGSAAGGTVGDGQYWSNTDLTRHDLGQTSSGLTAEELDEWINAKAPQDSIMRGMGSAFMTAGEKSGLDPRYLVAHAAHETAWGTSNIAKDKGNMYGIGAFDASPYASAYGYNNTQAGIIEGAQWIAKNYYDEGQTTLHDMINGNKKYATDPEWANKIGNTMRGAEQYTSPSIEVNINGLTYQGSGNPEQDGAAFATGMGAQISNEFTQEQRRI